METLRTAAETGLANANRTTLYYELRGNGPPVMFISGATGDAGHFEKVAGLLADRFTVLTYDRRANSRSPRPTGWSVTSADEQADDAAALLTTLGLAPATVVGGSSGAIIALNLAIRHPECVRAAILQEPPLMQALADPAPVMTEIRTVVDRGMALGGHRGAVEAFLRFAGGDANVEAMSAEMRERLLGNGETLLDVEFGTLEAYCPDHAALATIELPIRVLAGATSAPFFLEAAEWLAARLHTRIVTMPGAHAPYLDHPVELAEIIARFVPRIAASKPS